MTPKFSSKEIHFLKTNSDDFNIKVPETYFCDILLKKTAPLKLFTKRLSETKIPGKKFLCAVVQIPSDTVVMARTPIDKRHFRLQNLHSPRH